MIVKENIETGNIETLTYSQAMTQLLNLLSVENKEDIHEVSQALQNKFGMIKTETHYFYKFQA
jgi:hypothetical protein